MHHKLTYKKHKADAFQEQAPMLNNRGTQEVALFQLHGEVRGGNDCQWDHY